MMQELCSELLTKDTSWCQRPAILHQLNLKKYGRYRTIITPILTFPRQGERNLMARELSACLILSPSIPRNRRIDPDVFAFLPQVKSLAVFHPEETCGHEFSQEIWRVVIWPELTF
jgi:hypothetical protein